MSQNPSEKYLEIDPDDLDRCLVEQPQLYYDVARAFAEAESTRDGKKLELAEAEAALDRQVRETAARQSEKLTEPAIANRVLLMPKVKQINQELLEAKLAADKLEALKEAYSQRSFMLRELVAIQLAELQNLQVERGATFARHRQGAQARAQVELEKARHERETL